MSNNDTSISPVVVLNIPRMTKDFITYARAVNVALLGNNNFPNPTPTLDAFAADITALEEAETNAATRAVGAVALRDAKKRRVKEDLNQLRSYVQSVVATTGSPANAASMVKSAFMSLRKPTTRNAPEISAKNADLPGKVILAARSLGPSVLYSWEYSLDQSSWTPIPDTMKARTEVSGLTPHNKHYFRFSPFTRAGRQGYSQVVSLFVH
ncbi:MAG TPA: hypothetical protein VK459_07105 [Polyangiaceae bacterium]|nr:hypothetical protein [Polyangiaceae bacterium]